MQFGDIIIIAAVVVAVALGVMFYLGKKNYAKNLEAQSFINQYKMVTPILVIDKRFERPTTENLPKNIYEKLPKSAHIRKMPIVKAKVGPQITTLMCDKRIYDNLAVKKTVKVELAGIYISSIIGLNLEAKRNKTWREKMSVWISKNAPKK
ncbi:MAG TPA: hypothetical protein DIC60_09870 [Lachnospiraceae bacterium]|nr:hypothetical protein [Lachnospiraceae bacterium]